MNDEAVWHKCKPPVWPLMRGPDGRWFTIAHNGQVWRRRVNGRWQYQQDAETAEEWNRSVW